MYHSLDFSSPDDFIIGVFQKYMKTPPTNTTANNPIIANNISIIDDASKGLRGQCIYCESKRLLHVTRFRSSI